MTTVSAVQSVRSSGLELVKREKRKGKLATARDFAKVNWKPWKGSKTGQYIPSGETFATLGITARLAYCTMLETRTRLIKMHRKLRA